MRRLLQALLLVLVLALAACGAADEPAEPAAEAPAADESAAEEEPTAPEATAEEEPSADESAAEEDAPVLKLGLVTDIGSVNDGTFNEFAHNGAVRAAEDFDLEYRFIETQAQADYDQNISTLVDEEFDVIVTVGFLIAEATYEAAQENPDTVFIGIDQSFTGDQALPNLVGVQFREDQGGFLAGALAGMMTESNVVGVVGGVDIPPVKRFRNGFDNGVAYINPDATSLGVYIPSFTDPAQGASAAEQFIGEGADVVMGAGGATGSGGITAAAEQGVFVIGVDQDEYVTTFGNGETPGADQLLTSAMKRVDVGVYEQVRAIIDGDFEGDGDFVLNAANGGITYADFHDTADDIPDSVKERLEEVRQLLASGDLTTGVDPESGDLDESTIPEPAPFEGGEAGEADATDEAPAAAGDSDLKLGLVTDIGRVNDGTFNEFAHEGALQAADDFGLEYRFIETQAQADYDQNIATLVDEEFDIIVTVGFLIQDATYAAAQENPDIRFIGVDQSFTDDQALPNLVGVQFREDQAGFLVGALAGMITESDVVGVVGGVDIPPVKRFRNGFDNGVAYVNPDATSLGVYIPSFTDPAQGASVAEQFIGEGADVIFGAGGPTGSGGIKAAAEQGVFVIGVDQDEYFTTFGGGESPGADSIMSSALKRVDVGVYDQVELIVNDAFAGEGNYVLDTANGGITYADFHETADLIPEPVTTRLEAIEQALAAGELTTGVDVASGDLDEATIPEAQPYDPDAAPPEGSAPADEATDEPADDAADEATDDAATTGGLGLPEGETLRVGLVTDIGRINDGTFNEFAHNGALQATDELDAEYRFIETQAQTDYEQNIATFVDEGFNVVITVGFLLADATFEAAQANPDIAFIGVDQSFAGDPERQLPNLVGLQFREDQAGFLAGALAGMMTETDVVGIVAGVDIPPVKRFKNGFDNGVAYINPDATPLGVYVPSFTDPAQGASVAEQFIGEGADVIFGAGGPTGSGGIKAAAEQGVFVIGVDQDEYDTTFGGGGTPGSDRLLTSALKRVDVGVYDQIVAFAEGSFAGNGDYLLEAANGGIAYSDFHEAEDAIPEPVKERLQAILDALAAGELTTGVDPASGDLDETTTPEPEPFDG